MILNILILILLSNCIVGVDYCSNNLKCQGAVNSGCNCNFGPTCRQHTEHKLTPEIKHDIVDGHNKLREKVANGQEKRGGLSGTATQMYALIWDDQLEYVATCWNKQCQFNHDHCRSTEEYPDVGQNIYWSSGIACEWNNDLNSALKGWYEEINDMTSDCLEHFGVGCSTMKVGHFTQLVWAKTARVGCSLVEYEGQCQITCNYAPAGNFQGEPMYVRGSPKCEFYSNKYNNLCLLRKDDESVAATTSSTKLQRISGKLYIIYFVIVIGFRY